MPTEKAHGFQIAKMCESFALQGEIVELIIPRRDNFIKEDIFDYYNVEKNFEIKHLDSFDFFKLEKFIGSKLAFYLQSLAFKFKVGKLKVESNGVVMTRNPEIVRVLKKKKIKVFYDAHRWPETKRQIFKHMLKNVDGVICNSIGTAQAFKGNGFVNILVAPNGVDLKEYKKDVDKTEIKNKYKLPLDKKILMYVGHLYDWKGVDTVMEAAKEVENKDLVFVFVGGTKKDIENYKSISKENNLENVIFLGHVKKTEIAFLQKTADVLLLPNKPINRESEKYTSPIKMFEYMASGVVVLASNLSSIREVLNKKNAILFQADNLKDFLDKINIIFSNNEKAKELSKQALIDVRKYSWEERAKKIINFVN